MVQDAPSFMLLIMSNSDTNVQYRCNIAYQPIFFDFKSICLG